MKSVIDFTSSKLSVYILALMLSACGGGGGSGDGASSGGSGDSSDSGGSAERYPEPEKDVADTASIGFYDFNAEDKEREIRPDLEGSFQGMVQFGQGHVVDPNGNEAKQMPRLTAEREALLLVTPVKTLQSVKNLKAEIYRNGALLRTVDLSPPEDIPASDQNIIQNRPSVVYSKRAWSAKLGWNEVQPGLHIKFIDSENRQGELAESKIDFASPGELVLNNIRIGMLTSAPASNGHYMLLEPEKAGADYFQTIPAAQMVVAKYDDVFLPRVMVSSGTIYSSTSSTEGGAYSGDMRGDTAKSTFSVGINLANWGVTSASMANQNQPQITQTVIVHHAKGKYTNGEQGHGLSGGNGMLTLYDSVGNEFSHEIGHHYGLGHYPGQEGDNLFWAAHHADSGWGYIGYRNKMRGNLSWTAAWKWDGANGIPNFKGIFPYGKDAMSGGYTDSNISRYTHYTGYSTFLRIQPHYDRYVWDETSPTGYKKWNKDTRQMEVAQPVMPNSTSPVWYQAGQNYLRPRIFGQPVLTILGGYDPVNQVGLLYPAARSNWGNVYDLPSANTSIGQASCWLNVQYSSKSTNIALAPQRLLITDKSEGNANKLHVNLSLADHPRKVDLYCKKANEAEKLLSTIDIPVYTDEIKPAVKIGREAGYSALRKIELPVLEQALLSQAGNPVIALSPSEFALYESYKTFAHELSGAAQAELRRFEDQQSKVYRLNRWMNVYAKDLETQKPEAIEALDKFKTSLGLAEDNALKNVSLIKNGSNCLKGMPLGNGEYDLYISGASGCKADGTEQWIYDGLGRIHNKDAIDQCLTSTGGSGSKVIMSKCSTNLNTQVWAMHPGTGTIRQDGQCMDLNTGHLVNNRQILIRYGCGNNNANQKWTNLTANPSLILVYLKPHNLKLLTK
ncbi:M66 family metalloprotease [Acinetobacter tianfuensis]|uniref:Glycosyl transferase n=1 Tax=Acinetobacter tianfuensis TaxID=2419603 RepID=A0A3A8EGM3_9GAMM|nr:M66 family metalloprotease [Acinetobacter tianfuensis]RKG34092.1 glycosyl transferase [Acinetobacter tianfuensis]